jgi:cysteine sulfinate desulfinase/cysteine desulfurase-like protein
VPLNLSLPTTHADGDASHTAGHNATNVALNATGAVVDTLAASDLRVLIYTAGAYPARPAGVAAGLVRYVGPVQPTTWLTNDEWINNS